MEEDEDEDDDDVVEIEVEVEEEDDDVVEVVATAVVDVVVGACDVVTLDSSIVLETDVELVSCEVVWMCAAAIVGVSVAVGVLDEDEAVTLAYTRLPFLIPSWTSSAEI